MYTPDKVAMLFLKFFVAMLIFSLITSIANIVPYYMQMNNVANDLILRAAVNNYILKSQVDAIIEESFVNNEIFNTLTYDGPEARVGKNGVRGIYVYARVLSAPGEAFPRGACNLGEYCPEYEITSYNSRHVIVDEGPNFDPKTNPTDMIKFRGPTYNGAQRGESITVRIEAKVNAKALFIGFNIDFQIPLAVEKSAPAMHYYRM